MALRKNTEKQEQMEKKNNRKRAESSLKRAF